MELFYSATVGGFYDATIHKTMPEDAKPISEAEHVALMAEQSGGKQIVADEAGLPRAIDPLAARPIGAQFSRIRTQRQRLLDKSDWTQLPDAPLAPEKRTAWAVYRQQLRDLPGNFDPIHGVVWPEPVS